MGLTAANGAFVAAGLLLYCFARRDLLRATGSATRHRELLACGFVAALTVAALGLAHMGINESWTGRIAVTDLRWLEYSLLFAVALLATHLLLRLQGSKVDEFVLPIAALLTALGLVNIYVWETRDANAYVSTVALPALREYQAGLDRSRSLRPAQRAEIRSELGAIPNEIDYEDASRFATVLEPEWLATYNSTARRFEAVRADTPAATPDLPVREVRLHSALRKQLLAAILGLLSIPLLLFALSRRRVASLAGKQLPLYASASLLAATTVGVLITSPSRSLPALLEVGDRGLIVFEPVKLGLVVVLALALARPASDGLRREPAAWIALGASGFTVAVMVWRDVGVGIALALGATLMLSLVVHPRWQRALLVAGVVAVCAGPARAPDSVVPATARVRLEMWANPFGVYERAELDNRAAGALRRIVGFRLRQEERSAADGRRLSVATSRSPPLRVDREVSAIDQELRWRLAALESRPQQRRPFVPGPNPIDRLLLREAESLWADLGGFRAAGGSRETRAALSRRVDQAIRRLRADALKLSDSAAKMMSRRVSEHSRQ